MLCKVRHLSQIEKTQAGAEMLQVAENETVMCWALRVTTDLVFKRDLLLSNTD